MNGSLFLYVNGKPHTVSGSLAFHTLSTFLRSTLRATGTKIVCEEGDCGACTVLVGRPAAETIEYRPVNSCIQFVYQVHGAHVVTVEGLGSTGSLHPVQDSMVRLHGAQCGFCTPGFVVAMCAMYESRQPVTEPSIRSALTGNLCRCTGYEPIIKAGLDVAADGVPSLDSIYPSAPIVKEIQGQLSAPVLIESEGRTFFSPVTVEQAVHFRRENLGAVIVQGGTDVVVQHNKRGFDPPIVMNLSHVPELARISFEDDVLSIGATVTLTRLEAEISGRAPEFREILELFGAPQIRHAATLAGNIANASPIADSLPFLYVMDASVELTGSNGSRLVPIASFYLGYKSLDLRNDEIISRVLIPLPPPEEGEVRRLYKVSKRKNLDISTITAAFRLTLAGDGIRGASVAYGGVAPTVVRLTRTEEFLAGRKLTLETFRLAGEIACEEIAPISDVRGTAEFRMQLARNLMIKFYYEVTEGMRQEIAAASIA